MNDYAPVVAVGDRVAVHPATDTWMMGDRYGEVVTVGRKWVTVRGDSGRRWRLRPVDVLEVIRRG